MHQIWTNILEKWFSAILQQMYGSSFTKKHILVTQKMKNGSFEQRKWKPPKSTLFAMPKYTHVQNIGLFKLTIRG